MEISARNSVRKLTAFDRISSIDSFATAQPKPSRKTVLGALFTVAFPILLTVYAVLLYQTSLDQKLQTTTTVINNNQSIVIDWRCKSSDNCSVTHIGPSCPGFTEDDLFPNVTYVFHQNETRKLRVCYSPNDESYIRVVFHSAAGADPVRDTMDFIQAYIGFSNDTDKSLTAFPGFFPPLVSNSDQAVLMSYFAIADETQQQNNSRFVFANSGITLPAPECYGVYTSVCGSLSLRLGLTSSKSTITYSTTWLILASQVGGIGALLANIMIMANLILGRLFKLPRWKCCRKCRENGHCMGLAKYDVQRSAPEPKSSHDFSRAQTQFIEDYAADEGEQTVIPGSIDVEAIPTPPVQKRDSPTLPNK